MATQYITAEEVQKIMGLKQTAAYLVIKKLNNLLEAEGCVTVSGKCPRAYFEEKTKYDTSKT